MSDLVLVGRRECTSTTSDGSHRKFDEPVRIGLTAPEEMQNCRRQGIGDRIVSVFYFQADQSTLVGAGHDLRLARRECRFLDQPINRHGVPQLAERCT